MIWAWVDLEMTGLEDGDQILEFGMVLTDPDMKELLPPVHAVLSCPESVLQNMGPWCQEHHTKSGLLSLVRKSDLKIQALDTLVYEKIKPLMQDQSIILAGNSIHTDRRFIIKHMPMFNQLLHYRMLDVSTLKILHGQWSKDAAFEKGDSPHRSLEDIYLSIQELKYYKNWMFAS